MGTLNPLDIFPLEVWKIIFKNLEDQQGFSENLLNCSRVCTTFEDALKPTQCQWLFEPISQFVFPYLYTGEILEYRIICKEWCRVADNYLEEKNLERHRPFNKETTDISRSPQNKNYPPESRTFLSRIYSISEFLDPTEPIGSAPFIGSSLLLEDEEYFSDEDEPPEHAVDNIQNSFWKKSSELIQKYGEHVKLIEFKVSYCTVNAAEFYQNLRQYLPFMPNLTSLTISGVLQVVRSFQYAEIEDSTSLPQIPCLESLQINCEGVPRAIFCGKLISDINPSKLKCLKLNFSFLPTETDEVQFFEVKEPLPSVTELHLTGLDVAEYVKFMLEDVISREAPLGKLVLSFQCYANNIDFDYLQAINRFGGTLQMLSVEAKKGLERDASTGIATPFLKDLRTPHLRSLEISWDWRAVESGLLASRLAHSLEYLHISHVVDPNRVFPSKGDLGVVFDKQHSYPELYQDLWDEMPKLKVIKIHFESYSITCTKEMHEQSMKKFGELQWNELTPTFQKELLGKLQMSGRPFMNFAEILPINSKGINRLIRASENDETLLQKVIQDYYYGKKQSNGKICWRDLDNSLRVYLISKLRETSQVDSLGLEQVPLSCNSLIHLIKEKGDNPGFLGKIVHGYVEEMVKVSLAVVNDLFKVALLEYINKELIGCLKIPFQNPQAMERLVEVGMLRKASEFEAYAFSHDSVRHCVIGMLMRKLIGKVEIGRMNMFLLFHGGYMSPNPLGLYFADYMSEVVEESFLPYYSFFIFSDDTLANLLMTLSVMRLPTLQPVIAVLDYFNDDVVDIVLSRKLPEDMTLTLLHAAALRGDLERVRCLLYEFGFSKELAHPRFRNLMLACVENTKDCKDEQIQQRKEIINELLKLNGDLVNWDVPSANLNVHIGLIKFMMELGEDSWFTLVPKV